MSADDLLKFATQAPFVLIFVVVLVRTVRRPLRANVDTTLLFGAVTLVVVAAWLEVAVGLDPSSRTNRVLSAVTSSLIMAMPYLLLRLVDDFSSVPRAVMRLAEAGLLLAVVGLALFAPTLPDTLTLLYVLYFFGLQVYAARRFVDQARRSGGVTRRRMQAVAAGSLFLALVILAAGFRVAIPADAIEPVWVVLGRLFGLASGIAYFLGFAPPAWLRRTWQEPELRAFLGRAAMLPRLPDTASIVAELERGAAASLGAPAAAIGLWDEQAQVLRFRRGAAPPAAAAVNGVHPPDAMPGWPADHGMMEVRPGAMIGGRAFALQKPLISVDAVHDDPAYAQTYRAFNTQAILAAPITAGDTRLGVLVVYAPRAPIFAEDDLVLVRLLADQAAVILESRALIDEAARVRAKEEAARLKDDFLSSAAHDLKTPLTTLMAQAQLLERRALRRPQAPADLDGIQRIVRQAKRMSSLVLDLLDASRLEQGRLVGAREPVDLADVVREVCEQQSSNRHRCIVDANEPVTGYYDRARIVQLVDNLVENAVKYSPHGGDVRVAVRRDGAQAQLSVTDSGIGIPPADLPHVFDRFHRGTNVDDRRFAGMGLGLFICRKIVEQHGGSITVGSAPGQGTTFRVVLPVTTTAPIMAGGREHE